MTEVEITWGRVLRVWWASLWMGLLCVLVPCFIAGFILGIVFAILHIATEGHLWAFRLLGAAIGVSGGIWVLRQVLEKRYKDFRIAFVALEAETAPTAAGIDQPPSI